ncbi:gnat family [Fusarium longipes]|uniref:Gnat family n=1 Tax=Fusarium longipes TaxID=694270 RepID=A0A395T9B3_9HYPO|nr:gnat family [Fusarium longipes]
MEEITICNAMPEEIPELVASINKARAEMFPFLDQASIDRMAQKELDNFRKNHLDHPLGAFLTARSGGCLVATIGYVPYDGRFPFLDLETDNVVEVVRLYVKPEWRRAGIASNLFGKLVDQARQAGVKQLYLHTHPFLPNAIGFWESNGFAIMNVEDDPLWKTTHMSRLLKER